MLLLLLSMMLGHHVL